MFVLDSVLMDLPRVSDDLEPNSMAMIPGMGIPEQLKAAMEQEQSSKFWKLKQR